MQIPNATTAMLSLECEGATSDAVLQAARAAMPTQFHPYAPERQWIDKLPTKQQPLVPLLMALLDSAEAVAKAIADNAWDDSAPVNRQLIEGLASQAYRLGGDITTATQCPDAAAWSLPSMSGKELV
jgi:hypothetical protein